MDRGSGRTLSPWMTEDDLPVLPNLESDLDCDVCIVGAGIAGLSVAYHLACEGRSVIVLEDGASIGSGETARTTAHLSNAFDDRYYLVEWLHGAEAARLTAQSHTEAIDDIERIVQDESIDCDFQRLDGYLFVPPGDSPDVLEREYEACHRAGLADVSWEERAPFPRFETGRCLRFPQQAQFHPLRYLAGLTRAILDREGRVFVATHAIKFEGGKHGASARVETDRGHVVTAREVVVATNTPVQDLLTIHTKQYPYRTYVIGIRVPPDTVEWALYWDTDDPYHYVRVAHADDHDLLIVGGEDHKTGQSNGVDRYERLSEWARERFQHLGPVVFNWSGQVIEPMDALAFIGLNPGDENVWVVTGDSGNGMTHGAIAGMLLTDLILDRPNPWSHLYDPSRKSLRAALQFTRENLNMAAQYAKWLTSGDVKDESEIPPGTGRVVREGAHKVAVYRDPNGGTHHLSATCPHLGAILGWNAAECTWDCPAHGSRFDACGKVLNGPANTNLEPLDVEQPAEESERRGR